MNQEHSSTLLRVLTCSAGRDGGARGAGRPGARSTKRATSEARADAYLDVVRRARAPLGVRRALRVIVGGRALPGVLRSP